MHAMSKSKTEQKQKNKIIIKTKCCTNTLRSSEIFRNTTQRGHQNVFVFFFVFYHWLFQKLNFIFLMPLYDMRNLYDKTKPKQILTQ